MSIESNQQPEVGSSIKDKIKKFAAGLLVGAAMTTPISGETNSNYDPGKQNSQEISTMEESREGEDLANITERVSNLMLIGNLTANPNVEISLIPTDLIKRMIDEKDQLVLGKYTKELDKSGCKPGYLKFAIKWLNVVDNNNTGPFSLSNEVSKDHEQVSDYIGREDVIGQVTEGVGLDLFEDNDGENKAMLVNMDEDDIKNFSEAIDFLKGNGVENPLDDLNQNDFNTFFLHKYDMGDYSWSSDGVINVHGDKHGKLQTETAVKALIEGGFANRLATLKDGAGVMIFGSYIDVLAPRLAADNLDYLSQKVEGDNMDLLVLAADFREKSERAMESLGNIKDDDINVAFLYNFVTQSNLVKAFGADDWSFLENK